MDGLLCNFSMFLQTKALGNTMYFGALMSKNSPLLTPLLWWQTYWTVIHSVQHTRVWDANHSLLFWSPFLTQAVPLHFASGTRLSCSRLTRLYLCPSIPLTGCLIDWVHLCPSGCASALVHTRDGGNSALKSAHSIIVISRGSDCSTALFICWCSI